MLLVDKLKAYTETFAQLQEAIDPLKRATKLLEDELGADNAEMIEASNEIEKRLETLQYEFVRRITYATTESEMQAVLKEFEEAFYNAVLDYRNRLAELLERK